MASKSTARTRRKTIDKAILSRIKHLDVTAYITYESQKAVAYGGCCEVFKGCVRRDENSEVSVAIKRLRFHTGEEKVLKARPSSLIVEELAGSHELCSNSPKKSTYGQSCPIRTSYRCWATLSARKQASRCSFLNGCIAVQPGRIYRRAENRTLCTWPF